MPGSTSTGTRLVKADRETNPGSAILYVGHNPGLFASSTDFASDGVKGKSSISLKSDPGLQIGEFVLIDHVTTDDPDVVWHVFHDAPGGGSRRWFVRQDRSLSQILEVTAIEGTTVTFASPLHWTFQTAFAAQLSRYGDDIGGNVLPFVQLSGIEDIAFSGGRGGDYHGNVSMNTAAYCWVKNVQSDGNIGTAVGLYGTYRCEVRDSFIHSTADPNPGGGGYLTGIHYGGSDNLIENNIFWNGNKMIVMRGSGGGNVVAYNYMEDGYGAGYKNIQEVGLNAGHYTTPHMELLEGNQAFNADGDSYWGNSISITLHRNHLTATRRNVGNLGLSDEGNRRAASLNHFQYDYNFIGNVLGEEGMELLRNQRNFVYEADSAAEFYDPNTGQNAQDVPMWLLGYVGEELGQPNDPKVAETAIRHGNFDYVTNGVVWDPDLSQEMPASLYLTSKPSFFDDLDWPWVTPEDSARPTAMLPARARFDAMPHAFATPEAPVVDDTDGEATAVANSPECEEAIAWATTSQTRFDGLSTILGPLASADAATLAIVDPATLRGAVSELRGAAAEQTDSNPPPIATAVNDALVTLYTDLATSLDTLADAIEAGDQTAIGAAALSVIEVNAALNSIDTSPEFTELIATCPALG